MVDRYPPTATEPTPDWVTCQHGGMADPFGIPDNIFGVVEDDFYGLVGRIALVAALVEDRVLCLLWALDDQP